MHRPQTDTESAFTLIELLVVISIIGILASIVLVSLQGARDKGRIAAALSFATNAYQTMGDNLAAGYTFDEPSGNALDMSINKNDLTLVGSAARTSNTYSGVGSALTVDATSGGQDLTPTDPPTGSSVTMTLWVYVTAYTQTTWNNMITLGPNNACDSSMAFSLQNNGYLATSFWCYGETYQSSGPTVPLNTWTNVAVTVNGQSVTYYIDGKVAYSTTYGPAPVTIQNGPIHVGGTTAQPALGSINCFQGALDDVRIYSQAIASADIAKIYAEELPAHRFAMR